MCGKRICSDITGSYPHDDQPDVLSKMLEEKENNLELAAEIGKQLLERNQELEEKLALMETELDSAREAIVQLKHEVHVKSDLLEMSEIDMEAEPYITTIFIGQQRSSHVTNTKPQAPSEYWLEREVKKLKEENVSLKVEAEELHIIEAQEKEVIADFSRRLRKANADLTSVTNQLTAKLEESARQQKDISSLQSEMSYLRQKCSSLEIDFHHASQQLSSTKESKEELKEEFLDLKDKYSEVLELLHSTQDQLRRYEQLSCNGCGGWPWEDSALSAVGRKSPFFAEVFQTDHDVSIVSLAAEMEESLLVAAADGLDEVDHPQQSDDDDLQRILHTYTIANSRHATHDTRKDQFSHQNPLRSSSGESSLSSQHFGSSFRRPAKLELVKPMKDSKLLQKWAQLALPGLLDGLLKTPIMDGVTHRASLDPE